MTTSRSTPPAVADEQARALIEGVIAGYRQQPRSPVLKAERIADIDEGILHATGFALDAMSPIGAAASVTLPSFITQVRDDVLTQPDDVQAIFDAMPVTEKSLFWIEGTTRRWDGYTYFARDPDRILGWLDRLMQPAT